MKGWEAKDARCERNASLGRSLKMLSSFILPPSSLLNNASVRGFNKIHQSVYLGGVLELFPDFRNRLRCIHFGREQETKRAVQRVDHLPAVATAFHARRIQAVALRVVPDG